jgi:hypothetical protein
MVAYSCVLSRFWLRFTRVLAGTGFSLGQSEDKEACGYVTMASHQNRYQSPLNLFSYTPDPKYQISSKPALW